MEKTLELTSWLVTPRPIHSNVRNQANIPDGYKTKNCVKYGANGYPIQCIVEIPDPVLINKISVGQ